MNLFKGITKLLYWPICRAYACHLGDKSADSLLRFLCRPQFWITHRYWPYFKNPRTFNEKIWHRMLYNRDSLLTLVSDKFRVRDYVVQKGGSDYLIPLLWQGNNPEDIPFDELPHKFVIKANHGCGYNIIVQDKTQMDIPQIKNELRKWLNENFCRDKYFGISWGYKNIIPHITIEEFIGINGQVPIDYKFFCYSGRAEFVLMTFDRFDNATEKHFSRNFDPLDLWNGAPQYEGKIERPINYEEMLELADKLAKDLDFVRVDLYSVEEKIYFGELTCYPAGGLAPFIPQKYDYIFGEKWKIMFHQ